MVGGNGIKLMWENGMIGLCLVVYGPNGLNGQNKIDRVMRRKLYLEWHRRIGQENLICPMLGRAKRRIACYFLVSQSDWNWRRCIWLAYSHVPTAAAAVHRENSIYYFLLLLFGSFGSFVAQLVILLGLGTKCPAVIALRLLVQFEKSTVQTVSIWISAM